MKTIVIALLCSLSLLSCSKDDDASGQANLTTLHYEQTGCADKWGVGTLNDAQTLTKLRQYLDSKGVFHIDERIALDNQPDFCEACHCRTGKVIYVRTTTGQVRAYLNLGFLQ